MSTDADDVGRRRLIRDQSMQRKGNAKGMQSKDSGKAKQSKGSGKSNLNARSNGRITVYAGIIKDGCNSSCIFIIINNCLIACAVIISVCGNSSSWRCC